MGTAAAVAAVLLPFAGSLPGGFLTRSQIKGWYEKLDRPSWRPPNWLFGPMWTYLYATMGYASYLVYTEGGGWEGPARLPLALYAAQLLLNWLWTPLFFGAHQLKLAALEISIMWCAILACIVTAYPVSPAAAFLLAPYQCWVSLATALTYSVAARNPGNGDAALKRRD